MSILYKYRELIVSVIDPIEILHKPWLQTHGKNKSRSTDNMSIMRRFRCDSNLLGLSSKGELDYKEGIRCWWFDSFHSGILDLVDRIREYYGLFQTIRRPLRSVDPFRQKSMRINVILRPQVFRSDSSSRRPFLMISHEWCVFTLYRLSTN